MHLIVFLLFQIKLQIVFASTTTEHVTVSAEPITTPSIGTTENSEVKISTKNSDETTDVSTTTATTTITTTTTTITTTTLTTTNPVTSNKNWKNIKQKLKSHEIGLIVIGVFFGVFVIALVSFFIIKRRYRFKIFRF